MIEKVLYRYKREDGGTTVSPIMPEGKEYTLGYRLIADDGKTLTNGVITVPCVDVSAESKSAWTEINAPEEISEME
jgi:hypothetical protein